MFKYYFKLNSKFSWFKFVFCCNKWTWARHKKFTRFRKKQSRSKDQSQKFSSKVNHDLNHVPSQPQVEQYSESRIWLDITIYTILCFSWFPNCNSCNSFKNHLWLRTPAILRVVRGDNYFSGYLMDYTTCSLYAGSSCMQWAYEMGQFGTPS